MLLLWGMWRCVTACVCCRGAGHVSARLCVQCRCIVPSGVHTSQAAVLIFSPQGQANAGPQRQWARHTSLSWCTVYTPVRRDLCCSLPVDVRGYEAQTTSGNTKRKACDSVDGSSSSSSNNVAHVMDALACVLGAVEGLLGVCVLCSGMATRPRPVLWQVLRMCAHLRAAGMCVRRPGFFHAAVGHIPAVRYLVVACCSLVLADMAATDGHSWCSFWLLV